MIDNEVFKVTINNFETVRTVAVGEVCQSVPTGDVFCLCSCPPMQLLAFLLKTKDHFRVGAFNC
jgi:hypothetical protein